MKSSNGPEIAPSPWALSVANVGGTFIVATAAAYYVWAAWHSTWTGDFRVYFAAVGELLRTGFEPGHETLTQAQRNQSFAYTPYLYTVAALGRVFSLEPYVALQLAGSLNVLAFFSGWVAWIFVVVDRRCALLVAGLALVANLMVREETFRLSSETSLGSMFLLLPYPSMFAWASALWSMVLAEWIASRPVSPRGVASSMFLAVLIAVTLATHPLTGAWLFGLVGLRGLFLWLIPLPGTSREHRALHGAALVGAALLGFGLSCLWPDVAFLNKAIISAPEAKSFRDTPFAPFLSLYALAACHAVRGLVVRDRVTVQLIVGWLGTGFAYALLYALDYDYRARFIFFLAFFAQVLVGWWSARDLLWMVGALQRRRFIAPLGLASTIALLVLAVRLEPLARWQKKRPGRGCEAAGCREAFLRDFDGLLEQLKPGDVFLMASARHAQRLAGATGAKAVHVRFATHMPDDRERRSNVRALFQPQTSDARRTRILTKWRATHVVAVPGDATAGLQRLLGPPLASNAHYVLFRVPPTLPPTAAADAPIEEADSAPASEPDAPDPDEPSPD